MSCGHMVQRLAALGLAVAGAALSPLACLAQGGEQPIRIIYPFSAGGAGDAVTRLMAEALRPVVGGRPVIVESRTGAAGRIGMQAVKSSPPDGSTLLMTVIATVSIYPHFYKDLGYDPFKDFEPLSQLVTYDFAVAVPKRVPATSLKELVAWLKANPAEQSFASPGAGTLPFFLGLKLSDVFGLQLRHVSYKGSSAAVLDLVAGQLPLVITNTADFAEHHKAGSVRVLASSVAQPFIAGVPTFESSGFPFSGNGWYAMYAPAGTPAAILDRYSKVFADAVRAPDARQKLLAMGLQPTGTTRQELAAVQKSDYDLWGPIIKSSGFTPQQ